MTENAKSLCYNCGIRQATTRDHIIPKTLLPDPKPSRLLTVPACRECNESFSKDEEYFRDRLAAVIGDPSSEDPVIWEKAWESLQKPEARGKKLGFYRDVFQLPKPVITNRGIPPIGIRMNKERVNRVVEKMVRGFYYHLFKERLEGVKFHIDLFSSIKPGRNVKTLRKYLEMVLSSPTWRRTFGSQTWVAVLLLEGDRRGGIWVIGLLGQHFLFVVAEPYIYLP